MSSYSGQRYQASRGYTDQQHDLLASKIYRFAGIQLLEVSDQDVKEALDIDQCVDYVGSDSIGQYIMLQERFRTLTAAQGYNDFTIRLSRPDNPIESHRASEVSKMIQTIANIPYPFYLMYAVVKDTLPEEEKGNSKAISRFAFVDLKRLFQLIQDGKIQIGPVGGVSSMQPTPEGTVLMTSTKENYDQSSLFIGIDFNLLYQTHPECILYSFGFQIENARVFPIQIESLRHSILATQTQSFFQNRKVTDLTAKEADKLCSFFSREEGCSPEQIRKDLGQDPSCTDILHLEKPAQAYGRLINNIKQQHAEQLSRHVIDFAITMPLPAGFFSVPNARDIER